MSKVTGHKELYSRQDEKAFGELLDITRQVGRAFQSKRDGAMLDHYKLAKLVSEFSTANVYIFDRHGKILGYAWVSGYHSSTLNGFMKKGYLPEEFIAKMDRIRESEICDADASLFDDEDPQREPAEKHLMYVPIHGAASERLGTVMLVRSLNPFTLRDILLAEYLATLVGIEILHDRSRTIEEKSRERVAVQMAMRALSYSEVEAVRFIVAEVRKDDHEKLEGIAIASKVADRIGVTRSVIVSALRKLESAGLIESRSLGMKGTYIRVLSELFLEELGSPDRERMMA
jgi:transcriptional pleiotropic repressor